MTTRIVNTQLHSDTIVNQIAATLYQLRAIDDDADITAIEFGVPDKEGVIPLKVTIKEVSTNIQT